MKKANSKPSPIPNLPPKTPHQEKKRHDHCLISSLNPTRRPIQHKNLHLVRPAARLGTVPLALKTTPIGQHIPAQRQLRLRRRLRPITLTVILDAAPPQPSSSTSVQAIPDRGIARPSPKRREALPQRPAPHAIGVAPQTAPRAVRLSCKERLSPSAVDCHRETVRPAADLGLVACAGHGAGAYGRGGGGRVGAPAFGAVFGARVFVAGGAAGEGALRGGVGGVGVELEREGARGDVGVAT